jgi:hypothetical protein
MEKVQKIVQDHKVIFISLKITNQKKHIIKYQINN